MNASGQALSNKVTVDDTVSEIKAENRSGEQLRGNGDGDEQPGLWPAHHGERAGGHG